jgi:dipeptidyl-peptidase-4
VDEKSRVVYFTATGKTKGVHPYYEQLFRVGLDGKNQTLLTPEAMDHEITAAPDGKTFVDVYSTVETPQTAVVRDDNGKVLMTLAKQDIAPLLAAGWKAAAADYGEGPRRQDAAVWVYGAAHEL